MTPLTGTTIEDPQPFRLRMEHYEMLDRAGAFLERRVELIEGVLIEMSPQRTPHSFTKNELTYRLRRALEEIESALLAQAEVTLPLGPHSAPDPDIVLTSAPKGHDYIPLTSVALVVEIAATSLRYDLGDKKNLYAAAGIPEYWVVNVAARKVHRFWASEDGCFAQSDESRLDGPIASATIPNLAIDGSGIL